MRKGPGRFPVKGIAVAAVAIAGLLPAAPLCAQAVPAGKKDMPDVTDERINSIRDLSLAGARKLLTNGLEIAATRELKLAIAVVDRAGNLLAFARMDGGAIVTTDVAIGKARTAAYLKAPSKLFEDMINSGRPSMATTPGLLPLQGGMPVVLDGEVVGAVGVSGSAGETDQAVAAEIAASFTGI